MLNLGIDDAGRGPVIGPMVIAGCLLDEKAEKKLKDLGVRDSKLLTHKRRVFLSEKIKELAESYEVVAIFPDEIDSKNGDGRKLNEVEAIAFAEIVNKLNDNSSKIKVIADCPSPTISKWSDFLKTKIDNLSNLEISCEHKADKNHVSVSAASILAKCVREEEMETLKKEFGIELGSGYCSDPVTQKFLTKFAEKYKDKGIFRKTWITWREAYSSIEQKRLEL
jgi:ribonuclease HII